MIRKRAIIIVLITALLLVAVVLCFRIVEEAQVAERIERDGIRFTFIKRPVEPEPDVDKKAAMYGSGRGFGDDETHRFNYIARHVSAVTVSWSDTRLFKTHNDTVNFLLRLLVSRGGHSSPYSGFDRKLDVPQIVAEVEHEVGKKGQWLIWCVRETVESAYQDGDGDWWTSSWSNGQAVSLETKH